MLSLRRSEKPAYGEFISSCFLGLVLACTYLILHLTLWGVHSLGAQLVRLALFTAAWQVVSGFAAGVHPMVRRAYLAALLIASVLLLIGRLLPLPPAASLAVHAIPEVFPASALAFSLLRLVAYALRPSRQDRQHRVLIVGSGYRASLAWRELRTRYHGGVHFLGFVDDRPTSEMAPEVASRTACTVTGLPEYLLQNIADEIVIAAPARSCYDMIQAAVRTGERTGVPLSYMRDLYGFTPAGRDATGVPMFEKLTRAPQQVGWRSVTKRALDIAGCSVLLLFCAPMMLLIALGVKLTSRGPVFFVQQRVGLRRRTFPILKFRTMVVNAPEMLAALEARNQGAGPLFKLHADPRTTPFGRLLRKTSLDELPQLFNVLVGQMSLVGPRPISLRDAGKIEESAIVRRFSVKPGITGMWQVHGRSNTTVQQWVSLDNRYIDRWSVRLDLEILVRTVPAVLRRSGAM